MRISDWSSDVCSSDLAHIGARQPVLAVLLKPFAARRAMPAAVHHATDPDQIARLETGNALTDRTDPADDLMAGHAGITRVAPFPPREMHIRMADAAIENVDPDIQRLKRPPPKGEVRERRLS